MAKCEVCGNDYYLSFEPAATLGAPCPRSGGLGRSKHPDQGESDATETADARGRARMGSV